MRKVFIGLLVGLVAFVASGSVVTHQFSSVSAQEVNEPYTVEVAQQEIDEYNAAIQNCETPSLECLVRYTMRYSAIEWVGEMNGPGFMLETSGGSDEVGSRGQGAIAGMFTLIGALYANPPAQTSVYVADVIENAGFAPPAYAQGLGFASLSPILDLWKVFRNIAFFFFIGAFIAIGFMIMFRYKIGGNTAVTAQQAIPSVIVSLVLVTFSYAIAGLLIDIMYLIMIVIIGIFTDLFSSLTGILGDEAGPSLLDMNIFQLTSLLFSESWEALRGEEGAINIFLESLTNGNLGGGPLGWAGGIIFSLVVSIAVLISTFKLFFELLKSYFSVILAVVMAPVILMMGAIPGRNTFMPWVKGIFGNLMAFPTVLLALVMFAKFAGESSLNSGGFQPPFLIGSGNAGLIGPLLGFATILALPEIVKKVKEVMGASDGGFASVVVKAAGDRAKQGWSGKMPLGMNARNVTMAGVSAASAGAGAATGAGIAAMRKEDIGKGAQLGALIGGAAPVLTRPTIRLGKRTISEGLSKGVGTVTGDFISSQVDKFKQRNDSSSAGGNVNDNPPPVQKGATPIEVD